MKERKPAADGGNQTPNGVLDRRTFLLWGAAGVCALSPVSAMAAVPRGRQRALSFLNLHTSETLAVTYWADGDYLAESLSAIDNVLRDFRSGEVKAIDTRLLDLLYSLQDTMETTEPFHVISGYRSPNTNQKLIDAGRGVAKRSLHMRGMAIDIRLPGRKLGAVYQTARAMQAGGVGYYEKSNFIHVDIGRVRYW